MCENSHIRHKKGRMSAYKTETSEGARRHGNSLQGAVGRVDRITKGRGGGEWL